MSFQQLYYTSCQKGLSGYAGYQFNAVTPGTSAEIMRHVESLAAYEAPRSTAYPETAAELERCPVNLCYVPGQPAVLINVQYIGRDFSRRFGNHFAHALATADGDTDFGDLLPIELWRASLWHAEAIDGTELPEFASPLPRGPLGRGPVAEFLRNHPRHDRLAALLSAVDLSQRQQDRPVLIVQDQSDDVAAWFAAVSYLLPPPVVRSMSFATYLSRPSRSRLLLLGTVTETDLDLGPDALENFRLFDFAGDRFTEVPEHPLARLLAQIGVLAAPALWDWAIALSTGQEQGLGDWYPIAAAAAAMGGVRLEAADLEAVVSWLARATQLSGGAQREIAGALRDHPELKQPHRRTLWDVGTRTGDPALAGQMQYELLEAEMLAARDGQPANHGSEVRLDDAVRQRVQARWEDLLRGESSGPAALNLLGWATAKGLAPDAGLTTDCARDVIGPWLIADRFGHPVGPDQQALARRLASRLLALRAGLAASLAATDPANMLAALSGVLGDVITEADTLPFPVLAQFYLVHLAAHKHADRVQILTKILERNVELTARERLLRELWPNHWTVGEATRIITAVDPGRLADPVVTGWFGQAVRADPGRDGITAVVTLCARVLDSPLAGRLDDAEAEHMRAIVKLAGVVQHAADLGELSPALARHCPPESAPIRAIIQYRAAPALARISVDPAALPPVLHSLEPTAFHAYLLAAGDIIRGRQRGAVNQAAALWLYGNQLKDPAAITAIVELLSWALARWAPKDLEKIAGRLAATDGQAADEFRHQAQLMQGGLAPRVMSVFSRLGSWRGQGQGD